MQRRRLLKTIGAGGLLSIGVGTGAATASGDATTDLDAVHVERDGRGVATLENPSESQLRRLHAETEAAETLVTPDECCLVECQVDCAYCEYGCCDWMYDC